MFVRNSESLKDIDEALKIVPPSWPLQNAVAVNPWWFYRDQPFAKTLNSLSIVHGTRLLADQNTAPKIRVLSIGEHFETYAARNWSAVTHLSRYCSAYLDERQASAPFPWRHLGFFDAWLNAQEYDKHFALLGFEQFRQDLATIRGLSPHAAIDFMLVTMRIDDGDQRRVYMQRLLASVMGWASQFRHCEWQSSLGYSVESPAQLCDLLAVAMAYDFLIFQRVTKGSGSGKSTQHLSNWVQNLKSAAVEGARLATEPLQSDQALSERERSYQSHVAGQLLRAKKQEATRPQAQLVFCIDVRSEILRRHIESRNSEIQTLGFAGFFGVAFDYNRATERKVGHRLPVLLAPGFEVDEVATAHNQPKFEGRLARAQAVSYFRGLRKNPISSFLYVELFGLLYFGRMIWRAALAIRSNLLGQRLPKRFDDRSQGPCQVGTPVERIDRAETVLRHMGLINNFSPLVCLVGHGSATTNNAFGSTLDCGACGGHAGDINARFLADLLSDSLVRKGLGERGIEIPPDTDFVAAVHETVTDEIYFLDSLRFTKEALLKTSRLKLDLKWSAEQSRVERFALRSHSIEPNADKRSHNWSEVRPEWALAGNASFIVAPRSTSRGVNLAGRSFLHDYDWTKDAARGFKTLELIMTAPMVVTNWINLQYYASTVAPDVYGSGSKVLHNLVNETGVVEGNGGDLRIGLPIQSVHDGKNFVHEPLRLSVFIEAPKTAIEEIVAKHQVVRDLVDGQWIHLIHVDPLSGAQSRRQPLGAYVALSSFC